MMKDECYDLELYDWKKLDGTKLEPVSTSSACPTPRQMYLCVLICDALGICDVLYAEGLGIEINDGTKLEPVSPSAAPALLHIASRKSP